MCPLPERACVVKGGLCGLFRLGQLVFLLCLQRICAVRQDGLFGYALVCNCSLCCCCRYRFVSTRSRVTIFIREVCSVVLFKMRPCLYPSLRGLPRTVRYVRARANSPDTDKIYSIVLRDSNPLHNQDYAWRQWSGQGDTSSWQGAEGIRAP